MLIALYALTFLASLINIFVVYFYCHLKKELVVIRFLVAPYIMSIPWQPWAFESLCGTKYNYNGMIGSIIYWTVFILVLVLKWKKIKSFLLRD